MRTSPRRSWSRVRRSWSCPWTIRNHRVYGRWIAVASEGGVTFWTGNHPLARGDGDLAANPRHQARRARLSARAHPGLTRRTARAALLPRRPALDPARPGRVARAAGAQGVLYGRAVGPSYALHSTRYSRRVRRVVPAAAARARSRARWQLAHAGAIGGTAPPLLWLMAAATVAAGLVFFPQERFRIPVIDPALIVTARAAGAALTDGTDERPASSRRPITSARTCRCSRAGVLAHDGFRAARRRRRLAGRHGRQSPTRSPREHPGRVEVMHRTGPRGLGRSYVDGLLHAIAEGRADFICQMDADLSHDPEYLPALVTAAAADARPRHRLALPERRQRRELAAAPDLPQRVRATATSASVTSLSASDCTSGYRCWRREALARLPLDGDGLGRLRVPRRDAVRSARSAAAASAKCRSSSSSGARDSRSCRRTCCSSR